MGRELLVSVLLYVLCFGGDADLDLTDAILTTREKVFQKVFLTARESLYSWTTRIGHRPCDNITCNTNRIAGLNVFLLWSGLYPRAKLNRSLHEIGSALQYATATDTELVAVAIENGQEIDDVEEIFAWAARIRNPTAGPVPNATRRQPPACSSPWRTFSAISPLRCRLNWSSMPSLHSPERLKNRA